MPQTTIRGIEASFAALELNKPENRYKVALMSIAEIKAELDRLKPEDREKVRLYLKPKVKPLSVEDMRRLSAKIDNKNPAKWLTLEELKKRLGD